MKLNEQIAEIIFTNLDGLKYANAQGQVTNKVVDAILSALASTPDEKLLLTSDEKTKIAPYSNAQFPILIMNITKAQLTKVQPMITALRAKLAEAEKEKQEAVEKAVKAERKRILLWGIEPCMEHPTGGGVFTRRECPECWKSLRLEVKK